MARASTGRQPRARAGQGDGESGSGGRRTGTLRLPAPGPAVGLAVSALLTAPLARAGFDLEGLEVTRAGSRYVVAVAVDRDGGLDLDAVAEASRVVSEVLDAHDESGGLPAALREAYTLEVSSRGATSPLTAPRHWRRAVGRLVEVRLREAGPVTGRIAAADDEAAELDVAGSPVRIEYAEVVRAQVQLEFRRPAGPDPTGDVGADELDEFEDLDDDTDDTDEADDTDDTDDTDEEETP